MLAVLGFVTILLVLALIMSKKVSTLVALIFVPAITGVLAAFIHPQRRLYGQGPEQHRCHRCHVHLCHPVFQHLLGCRCL